jgi:hypothetical protein
MARALGFLVMGPPGNSTERHNFRQEYVTPKHNDKAINGHFGLVVIKSLQFLFQRLRCDVAQDLPSSA